MKYYFLNYHFDNVSVHARIPPVVLFGDGDAVSPSLAEVKLDKLAADIRARDVVFITHGFNVDLVSGLRSITRFANRLQLPETAIVVGVLWPGDFHALGVNYPVASVGAIGAGQNLGDLCNKELSGALSYSFVSHSLGARVILEATGRLSVKARLLCVTAGAVNDDCLSAEYAQARDTAVVTRTLSSTDDWVLQVLFRVGDPVSQVLENLPGHLGTDDHKLGEAALGRLGPSPALPAPVYASQIPEAETYGHHNYLAPSGEKFVAPVAGAALTDDTKWIRVAEFVSASFAGIPPAWPPKWTPPAQLRPWYWPFSQSIWPASP